MKHIDSKVIIALALTILSIVNDTSMSASTVGSARNSIDGPLAIIAGLSVIAALLVVPRAFDKSNYKRKKKEHN